MAVEFKITKKEKIFDFLVDELSTAGYKSMLANVTASGRRE